MPDKQTFDSIGEIRAHFYPQSANLLELPADEVIQFPEQLADDAKRIQNGAEATPASSNATSPSRARATRSRARKGRAGR